jgi:ubiquinone/menaquinone biosynthesis C-methylase UbiE
MPWLMASLYDRTMRGAEIACLRGWRAELLADLSGTVLEVGAGTGANVPHYPASVDRLVLSEPDAHMRRLLRARHGVEAEQAAVDALPMADESFDAVVATLLLCSVSDQAGALAEIWRVLRPGGRYVFIEHTAAVDDPRRYRLQRWVEPVWRRVADNCHTTRRTDQAIAAAGFTMERIERGSIRKAFPWVRPSVRGVARKPG